MKIVLKLSRGLPMCQVRLQISYVVTGILEIVEDIRLRNILNRGTTFLPAISKSNKTLIILT